MGLIEPLGPEEPRVAKGMIGHGSDQGIEAEIARASGWSDGKRNASGSVRRTQVVIELDDLAPGAAHVVAVQCAANLFTRGPHGAKSRREDGQLTPEFGEQVLEAAVVRARCETP